MNIKNFYATVLDQLLVIKLPDVIQIVISSNDELQTTLKNRFNHPNGLIDCVPISSSSPSSTTTSSSSQASPSSLNPLTAASLSHLNKCDDMHILLQLILGCAVQCERKEIFIEKIKQMSISTQHSIVECIQEITDNPRSVFLLSEWSRPPENEIEIKRLYQALVEHVIQLSKERDQLYQRVVLLSCELLNSVILPANNQKSSSSSNITKNLSSSNSSLNCGALTMTSNSLNSVSSTSINHCDQKSHYLVETAELKSKLRKLQQELEEKNETISEQNEILEQNKEFCNKLRHDNLQLTQEARTAKAYRDEIDVLNERVRRIDRLEAEVQRYKDRINQLDYCKTRIEELQEDNRILVETKSMLEEQLDCSRKRAERIPELEEKILKLNAHGNELNLQRELDKNQIERLIEELTHLRDEKRNATEELNRIQTELTELRVQIGLNDERIIVNRSEEGNLFDQMNQDFSKKLIKLEHENKKLQSTIEEYQNEYMEVDTIVSMFNNIDLLKGSTILLPTSVDQNHDCDINEQNDVTKTKALMEKSKIEKITTLNEMISKINLNYMQMKSYQSERNDLIKENQDLKHRIEEIGNKFETLERNHNQITVENQKQSRLIEEKDKKVYELESELDQSSKENQKLMTTAETLRSSLMKFNGLEIELTNLETNNQRLEQQNKFLEKELNRLRLSIEQKDKLLDENSEKLSIIENENQHLRNDSEQLGYLNMRCKELEKESKDSQSILSVQKATLSTLQTDLIEEKLRTERLIEEFLKIIRSLNQLNIIDDDDLNEIINIDKDAFVDKFFSKKSTPNKRNDLNLDAEQNGDIIQHDVDDNEENGNEDNENLSMKIHQRLHNLIGSYSAQKDVQIEELQRRLHDLKMNNEEMRTLISSLKRQLNIDEKSDLKESLDSLNEMQKKILQLEDENRHLRLDLQKQQENHLESQQRNDLIETKFASINEANSELKNKNAKLEVDNSLLRSQNISLENQTTELKEQMILIQDSIEKLESKCKEYEIAHRLLITDNESLQEIHLQLTGLL